MQGANNDWTQFSSVQDGIYVLGKASIYALHPISQKCPQCCLWNSSNVHLTDDGHLSSFQERASSASSFHTFLLQATDGVMFLALCPQVVSQASQHFMSSVKQATCDGCFVSQSICLAIALHSGISRAVLPTGVFKSGCWTETHSTMGFPFHFSLLNAVLV